MLHSFGAEIETEGLTVFANDEDLQDFTRPIGGFNWIQEIVFDLSGKDADLSSYSDAKIMTGLLIEDAEMIKKLGYTNYWQDQPASLRPSRSLLSLLP
jgi:hypothetical protein